LAFPGCTHPLGCLCWRPQSGKTKPETPLFW
jgi:hypothetical protein